MIYEEYSGNTLVYNKKIGLPSGNQTWLGNPRTKRRFLAGTKASLTILRFQWSTVQKHQLLMINLGISLFNILGVSSGNLT